MAREDFELLREKAVKFIGLRRGKSSGQVRQRLLRETSDGDLIESVISYLEEIDYVNDRRAGEMMARQYVGKKACSKFAVQYNLIKKGVKKEIADEIAAARPSDYDTAAELLTANYSGQTEYPDQRISGLLNRRGYSYSVISEAVAKWTAENIE
ncbi:MAG TPA: regulatory protein RecX [Clostridiaceae bacterium]|nr:regulatory protein RecX [Clostridiaceae bacterium]